VDNYDVIEELTAGRLAETGLKVESSGSRESPFNQYIANFQLQTAGGRKLPGQKLAEIQDVGIY
jgi:hypothetical protein